MIDLLFEHNGYDVSHLNNYLTKPVFVNSMNKTIVEIGLPVYSYKCMAGFFKKKYC